MSSAPIAAPPRPHLSPAPRGRPATSPAAAASLKRASAPSRLTAGRFIALLAAVGILVVLSSDQVVPASSAHQAEMRLWLTARASGFVTLLLLTIQVVLGLVLSHPTNKTTWKLSKRLFPWHENAWVFVLAFLAAHVASILADRYAHVGILGAFIPGLSEYRASAVALGTLALYALLVAGLTARYTRMLPPGVWLKLHRLSLGILALSWAHGLLAGTDSVVVGGLYGASFALVVTATAYRYWVARAGRPTFSTSLSEVAR